MDQDNYKNLESVLFTIAKMIADSKTQTWIAMTLENGWVNYGAGYNNAEYCIDMMGFVHLRGLVKNGTDGATIETLPAGFRPLAREFMSAGSVDLYGRIDITTAGAITPQASTTAPGWVCLDGITFQAGQ